MYKQKRCYFCGKFLTRNEQLANEDLMADVRSRMDYMCDRCLSSCGVVALNDYSAQVPENTP